MLDVKKIRKDFPMFTHPDRSDLVFLDNASTTFKPQCVLDAINQYYGFETSNSHRGDYDLCNHADELINSTRRLVAEFIGANPKECIFTTGTTNSLNLIAYGYARKYLTKDEYRTKIKMLDNHKFFKHFIFIHFNQSFSYFFPISYPSNRI